MGKVKAEVQNLIDKCYALYEKGGSHAVIMYINEAKRQGDDPLMSDVTFEWCKACESHMPSILGECLVCGQSVTPKERVIMYGDRIDTVGQLRHIMSDLDDHDQICIETIDLETGDTEDLYPMYVDVIEGIKLTDDTIVREIRFCQKPNAEPDTRDKQPLVDAVIEQLKSDLADGDCTVLDELLMKLPWEILKGSLPEDQWERFNPNKSFEDAKRLAIAEAKRKIEQGKLFKSCDESKESEDFTNGDPETLFSLASLYAQFVDDDFNNASDALYDALLTEFPEYE